MSPRPGNFQDISGQRFGRLTALRFSRRWPESKRGSKTYWMFRCDCGTEVEATAHIVKRGIKKSCGCLFRETCIQPKRVTHGETSNRKPTPEWRAWNSAKERTTNPNHHAWDSYGGRGITMCAEWLTDYPAFLAEVGRRPTPKHSIDRIDNERGYEPGNCRWATKREQMQNRREYSRWKKAA